MVVACLVACLKVVSDDGVGAWVEEPESPVYVEAAILEEVWVFKAALVLEDALRDEVDALVREDALRVEVDVSS